MSPRQRQQKESINNMTRAFIILLLLPAVAATSAFGSLGETPKQFESRRADEITENDGGVTMIWKGKTVTHCGFFYQGYAIIESFWFNDHRELTKADWDRWLAPYKQAGIAPRLGDQQQHAGYRSWFSIYRNYGNGTLYGVVMIDHDQRSLSVSCADAWKYFSSKLDLEQQPVSQTDEKYRTRPNETCWQWLERTGLCKSGGCQEAQQSHETIAYLNWGNDSAPIYDNIEIEADQVLLAPYPFIEPKPDNPLYIEAAEQEIKTRMRDGVHGELTARKYRRGVFVGYIRLNRPPRAPEFVEI
jgi:hypothetical protein